MAEPTPHRAMARMLSRLTSKLSGVDADSIAACSGSVAGCTLKPARYGGRAAPADEYVFQVCELARLDGSLGWLAAVFNAAAFELADLPEPAAETLWGLDHDALIATTYQSETGLVSGGQLTGRWRSVVGAEYADWLLLPADIGTPHRVLVRREHARVECVRDRTGPAGAGVCDVTISGVTVDERYVFSAGDRGVAAIAGAGAAAAVVGSADGVWRQHVQRVRERLATSYGGDEVTDEAAAQVAWAASDIDAAKLAITTSLRVTSEPAGGTRVYRQAIARARAAADRLLGSSRHALDASDPVTRLWRDVHAGYRLAVRVLDGHDGA